MRFLWGCRQTLCFQKAPAARVLLPFPPHTLWPDPGFTTRLHLSSLITVALKRPFSSDRYRVRLHS